MSGTIQSSRPRNAIGLLCAAIVLVGFPVHAIGERSAWDRGAYAARTRAVDASGLDLTQTADVDILYLRIRRAAIATCRAEAVEWEVKRVLRRRQCVLSAVDDAVRRVDVPFLTAVHRGELERIAGR